MSASPRLQDGAAGWAALPEAILLSVFALLPLDSRACAACACRHWRFVFNDRSLWRSVDFGAVHDPRSLSASSLDFVRVCSAARCVGVLETLDASRLQRDVRTDDVERLLRLHAATLRTLRLPACGNIFRSPSPAELRRLAAAASSPDGTSPAAGAFGRSSRPSFRRNRTSAAATRMSSSPRTF